MLSQPIHFIAPVIISTISMGLLIVFLYITNKNMRKYEELEKENTYVKKNILNLEDKFENFTVKITDNINLITEKSSFSLKNEIKIIQEQITLLKIEIDKIQEKITELMTDVSNNRNNSIDQMNILKREIRDIEIRLNDKILKFSEIIKENNIDILNQISNLRENNTDILSQINNLKEPAKKNKAKKQNV